MADSRNLVRFNVGGFRSLHLSNQAHATLGQGAGIDFQEEFRFQDEMVANRGEMVIHETGIACPRCRTPENGNILENSLCTLCENGFLYRLPREFNAMVTNISSSRDLQDIGFAVPGNCLMSTQPNLRPQPSDWDRITFTWPQPVNEGEVIERGAAHRRWLDRGGEWKIEENEDLVHYYADQLIWLEDEDSVVYYQDADFVFDGKIIRWLGNKPAVRKRYTVKYEAFLEWILFTPPAQRRDKGRNMGPRFVLQKVHAVDFSKDPRLGSRINMKGEEGVYGQKVVA